MSLLFPHITLLAAEILFLCGIGLYTWKYRSEPGAIWQSYIQFCKILWLIAISAIPLTPSDSVRNHWHTLYTILALSVCYFWLRSIFAISHRERRCSSIFLTTVHILLAFFIAAALTNPLHHLYWHAVTVTEGVYHVQTATLGYLALAFGYFLIGYASWTNFRWARACKGIRRRQAYMFLLPTIVVWLGQFLGYFPHPRAFEPHTIGFFMGSLCMAWAFYRWRAYSILPFAESAVLAAMVDALIVVDDSEHILTMNHAAVALRIHSNFRVGSQWNDLLSYWPGLEQILDHDEITELLLDQPAGNRFFTVRRIPLYAQKSSNIGTILLFKDVTADKLQREKIQEQQRAISIFQERERLARELHDGPGQIWSFLSAQTQAARLRIAKNKLPEADRILEQLQSIIRSSYTDLRESISNLQSDLHEDILSLLQEQAEWYRIHCDFKIRIVCFPEFSSGLFSPYVQTQVLRILQEALANVRKSAQTLTAQVLVSRLPEHVVFEVRDQGCGFTPEISIRQSGKYGLHIMQERAKEIGADMNILSAPDQGTSVILRVPVSTPFTCASTGGHA